MRLIYLVTGGVRSGKSRFAEQLVLRLEQESAGEKVPGAAKSACPEPRVVYIATAQAGDEEMAARIKRHRERRPQDWKTIEEPIYISSVLDAHRGCTVLIDCLTLWVGNLLTSNISWEAETEKLLKSLARATSPVVLVSNEVGWGIVPENELARQFRDVAGLVNQRIAEVAHEVYLMVAGIPLKVKGG